MQFNPTHDAAQCRVRDGVATDPCFNFMYILCCHVRTVVAYSQTLSKLTHSFCPSPVPTHTHTSHSTLRSSLMTKMTGSQQVIMCIHHFYCTLAWSQNTISSLRHTSHLRAETINTPHLNEAKCHSNEACLALYFFYLLLSPDNSVLLSFFLSFCTSDWVTDDLMADPSAVKPADWDEEVE